MERVKNEWVHAVHVPTNSQPPHGKGDRLKEATKINLSLSALGNVISALVDGGRVGWRRDGSGGLIIILMDCSGGE